MSVVFINNSLETFTPTASGAVATHIWECCRSARASGVEPVVISRRCGAAAYGEVRTILLDYPALPGNRFLYKLCRAQRRLSGWRYERQGTYAARVAGALSGEGLEKWPWILHNDPELAVILRRKFPKAFIVHHFHNPLELRAPFKRLFPGAVNRVTAVSNFVSDWAKKTFGLGSAPTIYNGVDSSRFNPNPAVRSADEAPVINFLGRTGIEKAPDLLLKSAIKLARNSMRFKLQILGSNHWDRFEMNDYQKVLQGLADELEGLGVEIRRPGHIDRGNVPGELQKADIHVVPSRWDEPCALTIFEGMAAGLATVASATGGTPEVVGDAGLLFERDSVDGLAAHLESLVGSRELRARYAGKARERAKSFTWEKTWLGFLSATANA